MNRLHVGDKAPFFTVTTHRGERFCANDFVGKRALVVFFYPRDGTPVCTREACAFRDAYDRFVRAGAEVIGISSDSVARHEHFAKQHELPFPLISDPDGVLRKAFGLSKLLGAIPPRSTFVIDKHGIIRLVYSALLASDAHVQAALAALVDSSNEPAPSHDDTAASPTSEIPQP